MSKIYCFAWMLLNIGEELSHKVSMSCLRICRRVVSKNVLTNCSVNELSCSRSKPPPTDNLSSGTLIQRKLDLECCARHKGCALFHIKTYSCQISKRLKVLIFDMQHHLVVLYQVCSNCGSVVKRASSWRSQS